MIAVLFLLPLLIAFVALPVNAAARRTTSARQAPQASHPDLSTARRYSPIVWLATDERFYPVMPHAFAFDGVDNDGDSRFDLEDPDEVDFEGDDIAKLSEQYERMRAFRFVYDWDQPGAVIKLGPDDFKEDSVTATLRVVFKLRGVVLAEICRLEDKRVHSNLLETFVVRSYEGIGEADEDSLKQESNDRFVAKQADRSRRGWRASQADPRQTYHVEHQVRDSMIVITRPSTLPPARVGYWLPDSTVKDRAVIQYWMYYLCDIGSGAHRHDNELLSVFRDETGLVVGAVGSGHTDASANNIVVTSRQRTTKAQFPTWLPEHMPVLVELGKHASAPDRNFDGRFDIGMDANVFYEGVWGSRDVAAALGISRLRRMSNEYSFPRDRSGLFFEEVLDTVRTGASDSRVRIDPSDRSLFQAYAGVINSRFTGRSARYSLFPLDDMRMLVCELLGRDSVSKDSVIHFLEAHKHCFWGSNPPPRAIAIDDAAFERMKLWNEKPDEKRDAWTHGNFREPKNVFKLWLFPRATPSTSFLIKPDGPVIRQGLQLAEIRVPAWVPLFGGEVACPFSTIEVHADLDPSPFLKVRDIGLTYYWFRGSHHGWYGGLSRSNGLRNDGKATLSLGLIPMNWDRKGIPGLAWTGHGQLMLRIGVRGEIPGDGFRVEPFGFQLGITTSGPFRIAPTHPLKY